MKNDIPELAQSQFQQSGPFKQHIRADGAREHRQSRQESTF